MSTSLPNIDTPLVRDGGGQNLPAVVKGLGPPGGNPFTGPDAEYREAGVGAARQLDSRRWFVR